MVILWLVEKVKERNSDNMFRLYGNNKGMKLLDVSDNEFDIVDTLGSYIGILDEIDYIIIENDGKSDNTKEVIKNYNDYLGYKHSVFEENKELIKVKKYNKPKTLTKHL